MRRDLNATEMNILVELDEFHENGKPWVYTRQTKYYRTIQGRELQTLKLIEGQGHGSARQIRMTEEGRIAFARGYVDVADAVKSSNGHIEPDDVDPIGTTFTASASESTEATDCNDGCATCVYRDALDIVAAKHPAARKLVEALKELNRS